MALVMLFNIELIFPRSTLARFKGAGLRVVVGEVTADEDVVWTAAGSDVVFVGGAKVGDLAAIALVDLETIGGGAFSFLSSTEEKKKKT